MSSANPSGHNWNRKPKAEEEEEDPFDKMISRTGCASFHYAVQECMAEHQDWRKCQEQVKSFKDCMMEHEKQRMAELLRKQKQHQTTS
ncbi:cytochrome c oxidase assembly factor 4 homolog, mitochondrial [Podarcis raffonei]|uniref:cytochrome c oxidase assembly factor 4 homolog, mitochondrial n=1 Tax=Podarcis raffonei TaxID=65483 RepID=UPI00232942D4|nr:cytochrome c oxidase assembly factor 4 homolog, mitochondrial [Podarcis raffonei]